MSRRWRVVLVALLLLALLVAGFVLRLAWRVPAPAQVLRVSADGRTVDEVYLNDGQPIAAASVAARFANRLFIGQIFGNGFLDCEMQGP